MQVFIDFLAPIVDRVQQKAQTAQNTNRKGGGQQRSLRTDPAHLLPRAVNERVRDVA